MLEIRAPGNAFRCIGVVAATDELTDEQLESPMESLLPFSDT